MKVEKSTVAVWTSFMGGILMLTSSLMFVISCDAFSTFTFGFNFLLLPLLLIGGLVTIACSVLISSNPKTARVLGAVMIVFGVITCTLVLRFITPIGLVAGFGGVLVIIGGAFAVAWKPPRQVQLKLPIP